MSLIQIAAEADDQGRRAVAWAGSDCSNAPHPPGFSIQSGEYLHLQHENQDDESDVFGTFFACWVDGDIYGPRLFYHNADGTTPDGCADLLLVPRCTNDTALVDAPVASQCYQGGLPA